MEIPSCRSVFHACCVQGQKLLPVIVQPELNKQTILHWSSKKPLDCQTRTNVPDFLKFASDKQRKFKL